MTRDELNMERKLYKKKLKELQQTAPYLWVFHLKGRLRIALAQGDVNKVKALLELIKKEGKNKTWRQMKQKTGE